MSHTKEFDVKRNEIVDCAERLFISRGYELTTVNAILKEVGIAKGTFYYYFASKEEVMDAVIMKIVEEDWAYAKKILATKQMTAFEKLMACLFVQPKSENRKVMIEQLYEANNAIMKQRALQRTLEVVCPVYAQMVQEGTLQGEFSSSHPLADMQFLLAGIQSLYDLSNVEHSRITVDPDSVLDILFRVLQLDEATISKEDARAMLTQSM